jgi:hypothetical protein
MSAEQIECLGDLVRRDKRLHQEAHGVERQMRALRVGRRLEVGGNLLRRHSGAALRCDPVVDVRAPLRLRLRLRRRRLHARRRWAARVRVRCKRARHAGDARRQLSSETEH